MEELRNTEVRPLLPQEQAIQHVLAEDIPFSVMLCTNDREKGEHVKERIISSYRKKGLQVAGDRTEKGYLKQTIWIDICCTDILAEPYTLLESDFLICCGSDFSPEERKRFAHLTDGLVWYAVPDEEWFSVPEQNPLCGNTAVWQENRIADGLYGLILIKGLQLRRHFRRQAVRYSCLYEKTLLQAELEKAEEQRKLRYEKQMMDFYKFLRIWNEFDNHLRENGDFIRQLEPEILALTDPERFSQAAKRLICGHASSFLEIWEKRFLHALPWSGICQTVQIDFYRTVLNYTVDPPRVIGTDEKTFWDGVLGKPERKRYNAYGQETMEKIKTELLPQLRKKLKELLTAYREKMEQPSGSRYSDGISGRYMELTRIEQQVSGRLPG